MIDTSSTAAPRQREPGRAVRAALRLAYLPFMLLGLNALGLSIVASGRSRAWLLAVLGIGIAASFGAERLIPYRRSWNRWHGDAARDVWHFVVNEGCNAASLLSIPLIAAWLPWPRLWPTHWPLAGQLLLAILVADCGITLMHALSHRHLWLWRLHAIHHSVKRHYGFNGLMKHPMHQSLETLAGVTPLLLLGLPVDVGALLALASSLQLLLQHSNADYAVGPLGAVLALNRGHRFHHLKWPGEGDVNFGFFTHLWDHLLGTWSYDPERRFTSEDFGIGAEPDFPKTYLAQLAAPFSTRRAQ